LDAVAVETLGLKEIGMDAAELDLEDLPPKALRKLIKSMLAKAGKKPEGKDAETADEEREALSDLHEETNGKPAPIPVTKDDLPPELSQDDEEESEDEDEEIEAEIKPSKKKGK
jgi:hypothetical protein